MLNQLTRRKPLPSVASGPPSGAGLLRNITLFQLTLMGVSTTLGTGIFFVLAETVPIAGPAVILAFVLAGLTAGFSALCYAEVSSQLPVSGSSYTFAYMTMGEGVAIVVVSCLLLEWGIAGAATAVGWSQYLEDLSHIAFGVDIPDVIQHAPLALAPDTGEWVWNQESYINLPAVILIWLCAALLLRGSHESALVNAILATIKLSILALFVVLTLTAFDRGNFSPFMPHGISGVGAAASIVFFSFIGLDAIVNASEETINPSRNIPRAIIGALIVVTGFYALIAASSLGVQPAQDFVGHSGSLTMVLQRATGAPWLSGVLAAGAVVSIFSVTLICLYSQSRILLALARDGFVPQRLGKIHPKTHSPSRAILLTASILTPLAGFLPSSLLLSMVSLGTLLAFSSVAISLMILRSRFKVDRGGYRTPVYPLIPMMSLLSCGYLISQMNPNAFRVFSVWLGLVVVFYLLYGRKHASLGAV